MTPSGYGCSPPFFHFISFHGPDLPSSGLGQSLSFVSFGCRWTQRRCNDETNPRPTALPTRPLPLPARECQATVAECLAGLHAATLPFLRAQTKDTQRHLFTDRLQGRF